MLHLYTLSILCTLFLISSALANGEYWGYFKWTDEQNPNRTNLYCPNGCKESNHLNGCCLCSAVPLWELNQMKVTNLNLEYIDRRGHAVLLLPNPSEINRIPTFTRITYSNGFLAFMPINLCSFPDVVAIDLSHNLLKDITGLFCLHALDTLDLSYNRITSLSNSTFSGLSVLRKIDLSHNLISEIAPYTIVQDSLEIFSVDLTYNQLVDLDLSNIIMEKSFCKLRYDHNKIEQFVNKASFKIEGNKTYADNGYVDLSYNDFKKFFNFTELGLTDLTLLGKLFNFAFDLRGSPLHCDCNMEPYLQKARNWVKKMWKDYFDLKCTSPPSLAGKSIGEFVARNITGLDELQCDISSRSDGCPFPCKCYRQPSQERTVVDCNSAGLTQLPKYMPPFNDLQVFLGNNSIMQIDPVDYLNRITHLDLSGNGIEKITEAAAKLINNNISIVLEGNKLKTIPASFKSKDPCKLHLGYVYITCNCQTKWVPDWLSVRQMASCGNLSNVFCQSSGGMTPAAEFDFDSLDCDQDHLVRDVLLSMVGLSLACIGTFAVLYSYRYEIYLLRRNPKKPRKNNLQYKTDVYITLDEEDRPQLIWTINVLIPYLKIMGFATYFPPKDSIIGNVKEEEIIHQVAHSRNYIILLSWKFTKQGGDEIWQGIEWRHIWTNFKNQSDLKNIIVINYAQLRPRDFEVSPIRAFLGLNLSLDFANRKHTLLEDICLRLGRANKFARGDTMKSRKKVYFPPKKLSNAVKPCVKEDNNDPNSLYFYPPFCKENQFFNMDDMDIDNRDQDLYPERVPSGIYSRSHHRIPKTIDISL
uniref:Uncharacterized protein LOC111104740 n=1 Tax=Crassostrea virginica TaxID=6565 RepID=A0A8B8AT80_CRAVI|nr:uncharacterized protein LOC111104740 [Crassostrea virginica]